MFAFTLPSSLHTFLNFALFTRKPKTTIYSIPNEVFVNVLFAYFDLQDLLRARRVCRLFYGLTKESVVWKRLLRVSKLHIPPVPPTTRYAFENLSAHEAEQLLVRAHSLDQAWRQESPKPAHVWAFDLPYHVAEMVLLPGSHYLVATVSDAAKQQWELVVCTLASQKEVIPIAVMSTKTQPYGLQARYLTVRGVPGITITYVREDMVPWKDAKRGITVSDNASHRIDAPRLLPKYECVVLHSPLAALEAITHSQYMPGSQQLFDLAKALPGPFQQIYLHSRYHKFGSIVLHDISGEPYLSFAKQLNMVVFKPLNGGPVSALNLLPHEKYLRWIHQIEAIRPLPEQGQILVARKIHQPCRHMVSVELHDIPVNDTTAELVVDSSPRGSKFLRRHWWTTMAIPELTPDHTFFSSLSQENEPLPLKVLLSGTYPQHGVEQLLIKPSRVEGPPPRLRGSGSPQYHYRYCLTRAVSSHQFISAPEPTLYHFLPGGMRSLLYTLPKGNVSDQPSSLKLYKCHDRHGVGASSSTESGPRIRLANIALDFDGYTPISAAAWDETTGRALFAREGQMTVQVVDFAHSSTEDVFACRAPAPAQYEHSFDDVGLRMVPGGFNDPV